MAYYIIYNNTEIYIAENAEALTNLYSDYTPLELPSDYNSEKYIVVEGELILNPNYEEEQAIKRRQYLDSLTLTPADVERELYKAKGMDFEDLKALIAQALPQVDIKGLSIEFRAKDFYRGAEASGMRLFDVVGQLLGYTPDDMDYLFENKELPQSEA